MDSKLGPSLVLLCALLSTACPGDDGGDTGADTGATGTTAASTSTASPTDTDSGSAETGTETETIPPDTETDADTETDTGMPIEGCECIEDQPVPEIANTPEVPAAPTCGQPLCSTVSGACTTKCFDGTFVLDDAAALTCALEALRDRTPGVVRWSFSENTGQFDDAGYILIRDDGRAVRRSWGWQDLSYVAGDAVLGELRPAAEYDACLAEPDDLMRFDCMRETLAAQEAVCDEGWRYDDI